MEARASAPVEEDEGPPAEPWDLPVEEVASAPLEGQYDYEDPSEEAHFSDFGGGFRDDNGKRESIDFESFNFSFQISLRGIWFLAMIR